MLADLDRVAHFKGTPKVNTVLDCYKGTPKRTLTLN